jgi:hypothetical protein
MIAWTREPFMPTQAPTGSTSRSLETTAILGALARFANAGLDDDGAVVDFGTSISNSRSSNSGEVRETSICGPFDSLETLVMTDADALALAPLLAA